MSATLRDFPGGGGSFTHPVDRPLPQFGQDVVEVFSQIDFQPPGTVLGIHICRIWRNDVSWWRPNTEFYILDQSITRRIEMTGATPFSRMRRIHSVFRKRWARFDPSVEPGLSCAGLEDWLTGPGERDERAGFQGCRAF